MIKHGNQKTSVSALMGAAIFDANGDTFGHVREFAVAPSVDSAHVHGIVLKRPSARRGARPPLVPVTPLQLTSSGGRWPLEDDAVDVGGVNRGCYGELT